MNDFAQQKTVEIARGLFLIRYNKAEDNRAPPIVRIFADPSSEDDCEIIVSPESDDGTLWSPESGLVVLATKPSRLIVEVTPQGRGGSTAANVKIEPLGTGQRPARAVAAPRAAQNDMGSFEDFQLLAHVAGVGDATAGLNKWIAGPLAPSRVEGICLNWAGKPQDLDLNYAVKFARPQRGDNQLVPMGTFAGTRGRALALTGVTVEASGPAASRYNLTVEAIFLGAPAVRTTGQRIDVTGPSGREPLVGIRINVEPVQAQVQVQAPPPRDLISASPRSTGRVRVFRSRQSSGKPAG